MKKKAVSPLIATVLLIGFTVALVALLIVWGTNYLQETAEKEGATAEGELECQTVDFTIQSVSYSGGNLDVTISNFEKDPIDAFVFRVEENGEYYPYQVYDSVESAVIETITIDISDSGIISIDTVEVVPRLSIASNVYVTCDKQSVTWQV